MSSSSCAAAAEETDEGAGRRHDHQSGSADEMIGDVLDIDDGEEFGRYGFRLKEFWQFTGPAWMVSIAYLVRREYPVPSVALWTSELTQWLALGPWEPGDRPAGRRTVRLHAIVGAAVVVGAGARDPDSRAAPRHCNASPSC